MADFYDKVAKKFGGYAYGTNKVKYTSEYPDGAPEEIFKEKLLELANPSLVALDIGCGDGKFAFEISNYFSFIHGIDTSRELLSVAESKKKTLGVANVDFKLEDASKTSFPDNSFDIAYCRRGPSFYKEYYRLLKKGGCYLEIGIGERDCVDLKKVFGRGQGYGTWNESRLDKDKNEFTRIGFKIIFAKAFSYSEFYDSLGELDKFLQGVPIFEDFDSDQDRDYLETYCKKFETPKGVLLPRQRVVYMVQK
ncbi:MAG: SAM-dependent methyltransferase [Microgenomates group bacterium Gr01-1014_5]|nr:MAG: SAM-dependent methyltransferase [Microgenomates group bacterium Gr01-1014_5]